MRLRDGRLRWRWLSRPPWPLAANDADVWPRNQWIQGWNGGTPISEAPNLAPSSATAQNRFCKVWTSGSPSIAARQLQAFHLLVGLIVLQTLAPGRHGQILAKRCMSLGRPTTFRLEDLDECCKHILDSVFATAWPPGLSASPKEQAYYAPCICRCKCMCMCTCMRTCGVWVRKSTINHKS
jgi:hypothetical protein